MTQQREDIVIGILQIVVGLVIIGGLIIWFTNIRTGTSNNEDSSSITTKLIEQPGPKTKDQCIQAGNERHIRDDAGELMGRAICQDDGTTKFDRLIGGEGPDGRWESTIQSGECLIKGNISIDTGDKIYHMPGDEYYDVTVINELYGEKWFCSEIDAINDGWRRSSV